MRALLLVVLLAVLLAGCGGTGAAPPTPAATATARTVPVALPTATATSSADAAQMDAIIRRVAAGCGVGYGQAANDVATVVTALRTRQLDFPLTVADVGQLADAAVARARANGGDCQAAFAFYAAAIESARN